MSPYHEAERLADILARLMPKVESRRQARQRTADAMEEYLGKQKPKHNPPPTKPLKLEPPDLTEPEPF